VSIPRRRRSVAVILTSMPTPRTRKIREYIRAEYVTKASTVMAMVAPMILGPASSAGFDGGGGIRGGAVEFDMIGSVRALILADCARR
jgi:hypothetical protein